MHRTTGEDYVIEDGKRRYASANPPTQRATRLPAEDLNATQEEISIVIENAGMTLNETATADREGGWGQLWQAITQHGIIGSNALASEAVIDGKIASDAINTSNIKNLAITSAKLGSLAVIEPKIASGAVTNSKILNGAVTSNKLGEASVTYGKIAIGAIDRTHFQSPYGWSQTQRKQHDSNITTTGIVSDITIALNQGYIGSLMLYRVTVSGILSVYHQGYARIYLKDQNGNQLFDTHAGQPLLSLDLSNAMITSGGITMAMSYTDIIQISKGDITQIQAYAELYNETGYGAPFIQRLTLSVEELLTSY